ncbi:DOMON domain-containing protein [Poritiphilus flavus]|uniref:DOMON domain-containing protein n=1 Tax=Poritiphilus flavus TaxID=2697053 RepID=A0A6L9EHD6_9FLAO|nr:DOMON domain-containing protein [Poritiphilus flavus]NAS14095.1 hypothetical protein [Poritiphilus flavus]
MKKILSTLLLLPLFALAQQGHEEVGGMTISWKYTDSQIHFQLNAPNDGWVALGFNSRNDIKDTHLLMFATKDGNADYQELYVKAAGNPVPVKQLFNKNTQLSYKISENGKNTAVDFSIDLRSYPEYSTSIKQGSEVWLICAYSEDDDFAHHSMMRKHIKVTL